MRKTPFLRQNEIDVVLSQKRLIFLRRIFFNIPIHSIFKLLSNMIASVFKRSKVYKIKKVTNKICDLFSNKLKCE